LRTISHIFTMYVHKCVIAQIGEIERKRAMSKGISDRKKEASSTFSAMFDGSEDRPSPEELVVRVMHGKDGNNAITERQFEAAKLLLPYRLPKLATVEAHVATEELSHEDWVASLDDDDDE